MDTAQRQDALDTVAERQVRLEWSDDCPGRALAVRCARALGVRAEVLDAVLAADVLAHERTPLAWMRRILAVEDALDARAAAEVRRAA